MSASPRTLRIREFNDTYPSHGTVLQGDCISHMATFVSGSVDFILTDPPYLVNYRPRSGQVIANDNNAHWVRPAFAQMYRVLKSNALCVSFYGWSASGPFLDAALAAGFRVVGHLVFIKRYAASVRYVAHSHEQAFLFAKGRPQPTNEPISDVLEWAYTGNRLHPTQKPIEPLAKIIRAFSKPGDMVLDPFCGSGSTLIAAHETGRQALGIELDAMHCATANRRLAAAVSTSCA